MLAMAVMPSSIGFELLLSGSSIFTKSNLHSKLNRASPFATLTRMILAPNSIVGLKISSTVRLCSSSSHDHESQQMNSELQSMQLVSSKSTQKLLIDIDENGSELSRRVKGRGRIPAAYIEQPDGNWYRTMKSSSFVGTRSTKTVCDGLAEISNGLDTRSDTAPPTNSMESRLSETVLKNVATEEWNPPLKNPPPLDPLPWRSDRLPSSWVVFSDLHVSRATLAVCLRVLALVRAEAERRSAGVIFLGDFWQDRGALRIEPLNAGTLSNWRPVSFVGADRRWRRLESDRGVGLSSLSVGSTPLRSGATQLPKLARALLWQLLRVRSVSFRGPPSPARRALLAHVSDGGRGRCGGMGGQFSRRWRSGEASPSLPSPATTTRCAVPGPRPPDLGGLRQGRTPAGGSARRSAEAEACLPGAAAAAARARRAGTFNRLAGRRPREGERVLSRRRLPPGRAAGNHHRGGGGGGGGGGGRRTWRGRTRRWRRWPSRALRRG